jgi:hypothetical protein
VRSARERALELERCGCVLFACAFGLVWDVGGMD